MQSTTGATSIAKYVPVLRGLLGLADDLCAALRANPRDDLPKTFILAFSTKAAQTLRAIVLLYEAGLAHEAQSLVRVAFELRVTFDAFFRLLGQDARLACQRLLDSIMLEKVKQQRAVAFKGLELLPEGPTKEELEQIEREIVGRYPEPELKKIRKHGFSGLNVEERARQAGHADVYGVVYRNFSRNVHSADLTELVLMNDPAILGEEHATYLDQRDSVGSEVAFIAVAGIVDPVNQLFRAGLDDRFAALVEEREKLRSA